MSGIASKWLQWRNGVQRTMAKRGEKRDSDEKMSHFLTFSIGNRNLALPLGNVERVIRMVALVPVPEAPEWIPGLLNLHGRVMPVIDLRKRLGLPRERIHPDHRILVIQTECLRLGVMAEKVDDVTAVSGDHIVGPEGNLKKSPLLRAVIRKDHEMHLVLNADEIDSSALIEFEDQKTEITPRAEK